MQFQATCSKGNKKLILTLTAGSLTEARSSLHSQGYSIIDIAEIDHETQLEGNFFYFDAKVNGIMQTGKIQSTDIFKSYRKLIEDLKYDVLYIYTNEGTPEEQKKILTAKVKDGYRLYKQSIGEDLDAENAYKNKSKDDQELQEISPEILKEVEKYTRIIDSAIEKIQNIFLKYHATITSDHRSTLESLQDTLIQTKGTKNLGKMKSIIEQGLMTIGEVEVELLKIGMTEEKQKYLSDTNDLLKQIGSRDRIQTEDQKKQSINYKLSQFFASKKTEEAPQEVKEKKDTNSFIYFKNKRELDIYKKKLQSLEVEILKSVFSFKFAQLKKLYLKRKLVRQNIQIIDNRLNNKAISYTKIVHGFDYYIKAFFEFVQTIISILFYTLFFYSISFIVLHTLDGFGLVSTQITGKTILFITLLSVITFFGSYIRGFLQAIVYIPIIAYISYFLINNF